MSMGFSNESEGDDSYRPKTTLKGLSDQEAADELRRAAKDLEKTVDESVRKVRRLKRKEGVIKFILSLLSIAGLTALTTLAACGLGLAAAVGYRTFLHTADWLAGLGF